jgi:hypothetical protein
VSKDKVYRVFLSGLLGDTQKWKFSHTKKFMFYPDLVFNLFLKEFFAGARPHTNRNEKKQETFVQFGLSIVPASLHILSFPS